MMTNMYQSGNSTNTLYTTEFLQGPENYYFKLEIRSNAQNCGPRRTEHIHVEVLEELNAGHLNDILITFVLRNSYY